MAFWLAKQRNGQASSYIQRFDPRFWTINFPRPMMASITLNSADTIQVDCDFYHQGELAGLIWESEDKLDHPLLAYETHRDFSHTVLKFRWKSKGLITLPQNHGPTLTIEGRDASGAAHTWYVRLWNYAQGSARDAQIELRFSDLYGGWLGTEDKVHPYDIDRMFISLAPVGYSEGSNTPFAKPKSGQVILSNISCEGEHSMLETGAILAPPHDERMATAYDDAFNQTPERLVRNIVGLGYRDEVVHYVGMSHFPLLTYRSGGGVVVDRNAAICTPASLWHQRYFEVSRANGLDVIASLSYELFGAYCPDNWKQRAYNGDPAQTGWVPPSNLLSPANAQAIGWLKAIAVQFAQLLETAGQPVKFQVGEPWWWVMSDGRPCLYDNAAKAEFGGAPPEIPSMRASLTRAQTNLLDRAGAVLARSTIEIADAVRAAASGSAEILLLAFTPTILDPQMPEFYRANLPVGWAHPAFDRLQLEDYDWLTDGADAARRAAYIFTDTHLGYPIDKQDYLSGFVLNSEDAAEYWLRIDNGLDEAAARGVTRRFVWALPQVTRDGYTRLAQNKEESVQAFDDVLYPLPLGRSAAVSPEFSTSIAVTSSGHERRNSLWSDARIHFDVGPGIRSEDELSELIGFFRARRGPARGFRIADPFDFSSNAMTKQPTARDQLIGTGDGNTADFPLIKFYGDEYPQKRFITRPRADSVRVSVNGKLVSDWELKEGGTIRFNTAPANGTRIRAGFLFDVPVRFAEDRIDVSGVNFEAGEAPSIPLVEIRESE